MSVAIVLPITLPISEATIRHHAIDSSFIRGESYYERGAVTDLVQRGNTIYAEVEGSEFTPYRVRLPLISFPQSQNRYPASIVSNCLA